jgi:hypothetical protein
MGVCVCSYYTGPFKILKSPHNEQVDDSRTHGLVGLLWHFSMTVTSRGSATYKRAQASAPATVRARARAAPDGYDGWVLVAFFGNNIEKGAKWTEEHSGIDYCYSWCVVRPGRD